MLEIIYRIYEVTNGEIFANNCKSDKEQDIELLTDRNPCVSIEAFKEDIRREYGDDISFGYSKNLKDGDLYCVIIDKRCYNTEKFFG